MFSKLEDGSVEITQSHVPKKNNNDDKKFNRHFGIRGTVQKNTVYM